jgi:hypothetical protein
MKTALYGRIFFGASAVLFGVIALMWHDADTWQNLQHIWSLPFGTVIGRVSHDCATCWWDWGGLPAHCALGFGCTLRCLFVFLAGLRP